MAADGFCGGVAAPLQSVLILDLVVLVDEGAVIVVQLMNLLLLLLNLIVLLLMNLVLMVLVLLLLLLLVVMGEGVEGKTRVGIVAIVFRR